LQSGVLGRYWPAIGVIEIGNERQQAVPRDQQVEIVIESRHPQRPWLRAGQDDRLPTGHIDGSTDLVRMALAAVCPRDADTVMIDELSPATVDRGETAARHHGETRHPQQGGFDMELLSREGLDVHLLHGAAVDLAPRVKALPRRVIRSREPNDSAIAV